MQAMALPPIPPAIHRLFSKFPLYTHPAVPLPSPRSTPDSVSVTLWIAPPKPDIIQPSHNLLSADVECLKWQAYIALRGLKNIGVRWDIAPEGGIDGRLPSLFVHASRTVLGARMIPGWADEALGLDTQDAFDGYKDDAARDESRAWITLLEGTVHAALTLATPEPFNIASWLFYTPSSGSASSTPSGLNVSLATFLSPPPAPLSGLLSMLSPYGERVSREQIQSQYYDAIVALGDRLGEDEWFLGSKGPTALDALIFAYLHCLLAGPDIIRLDVARRRNLVLWQRRVHIIVQSAFIAV